MTGVRGDAAGRPRARLRDGAAWLDRLTRSQGVGRSVSRVWPAGLDLALRQAGADKSGSYMLGDATGGAWTEPPDAPPDSAYTGIQRRDLDGAPLRPAQAVRSAFRNMLSCSGRSSRSAFCWYTAFHAFALIVLVSLFILAAAITPRAFEGPVGWVVIGVFLVCWVPLLIAQWRLAERRLQDAGLSRRCLGVILIPKVGGFLSLILGLLMMLLPPRHPDRCQIPGRDLST